MLDAILAGDFPGVDNLREQAVTVRARRGCTCGCGTIELVGYDGPPDGLTSVPDELTIVDDAGEILGSVLLLTTHGQLSSLEVASYGDPLPMPDLGHAQLERRPGTVLG